MRREGDVCGGMPCCADAHRVNVNGTATLCDVKGGLPVAGRVFPMLNASMFRLSSNAGLSTSFHPSVRGGGMMLRMTDVHHNDDDDSRAEGQRQEVG